MNNKIAAALKFNSKIKYKNSKINYKTISLRRWLKNHKIACLESIKTLYEAPFSNLLTMSILGVALALPVLLYLLVLNVGGSLDNWQQSFYQYSIYLDAKNEKQEAVEIKNKLLAWPEVDKIKIITKEEGMKELKTAMGIDNALNNIQDNPLPIVLIVTLNNKHKNLTSITSLIKRSETIPGVTKIDADIIWLKKISNILNLFSNIIIAFSVVLGFAILLVIANTIRLILENKQQEMTIYSLLGATMAYIRRPYLYGGIIYGMLAGCISYFVAIMLFNKLYYLLDDLGYTKLLSVDIVSLSFIDIISLLLFSGFIGWCGARIALHFQCKQLKYRLVEI